jgi:hypothetical protein
MAGSVSLASISLMRSVFWDISKKPPEVGGGLLQFGEHAFELNEFHVGIVAGFAYPVKDLADGARRTVDGKNKQRTIVTSDE